MGGIGIGQDVPKSQKLYQNLIKDGYTTDNLGTYDDFNKALQNPISANKIYSGLRADGYTEDNLGTLPEFQSSFIQKKNPVGNAPINQGRTSDNYFPAGTDLPNAAPDISKPLDFGFPNAPNFNAKPISLPVGRTIQQQLSNSQNQNIYQAAQDKSTKALLNDPAFKFKNNVNPNTIYTDNIPDADATGSTWANLPTFTARTVFGGVEKDLGNLFEYLGNKTGALPGLAGIGTKGTFDALKNSIREQQAEDADVTANNQLPDTGAGRFTSSVIGFGPDLLELAATPELEIANLGKLGNAITKYGGKYGTKAAEVAIGKFPLQQSAQGMLQSYADAKDKGMSEDEANAEAAKGFLRGYKNGVVFDLAAGGANKLTKLGADALDKAGLMSGNKLVAGTEKRLLHATAQGLTFSAVPFVQNAIEGNGTSLQQAEDNGIFGAVLGGLTDGHGEPGEPTTADKAAAQVIMRKPLIDMNNFMEADIGDIQNLHNSGTSAADLYAKSAAHAENGFKSDNSEAKQQEAVQSSIYGKSASIKEVAEAILKDKQGVIDGINQMPIPDYVKQQMIDKVNATQKALDPIEQKKSALADQIKAIQDMPANGIVDEKEKAVALKDKNKELDEIITNHLDQKKDRASGSKITYSKGIGEDEGKFFKTTDGKKEEITEGRYNLEHLEREAKKQPDQPTELPVEASKEDATVAAKEPDKVVNGETTNNQITNPQINESETNKGGSEEANAEKTDAVQKEVETPGAVEAAPGTTKSLDKKIRPKTKSEYSKRANKVLDSDPRSLREAILHFFVGGGKISSDDFRRFTGFSPGKDGRQYISFLKKPDGENRDAGGLPLDYIAEHHVPEQFNKDGHETSNEIINTLHEFKGSRNAMLAELERLHGIDNSENKLSPEELHAYGQLTDEERDVVDKLRNSEYSAEQVNELLPHTDTDNATHENIYDQKLTEHHINELSSLLDKYSDQNGNIDWDKIAEEFPDFGRGHLFDVADIKDNERRAATEQSGTVEETDQAAKSISGANNDGIAETAGAKENKPPAKVADKVKTPSLTDEETARKNELRKKFFGRLNDITNIPTLLADKEFREYAGLVFKESLGDFKAFSKELIDSVGDKIKEHLPGLFKELGGKLPEDTKTGIRNADVATERGELVDRTHKTKAETDAEGKRLVDSGELDPDQFARDIIDNPKPATTEEQAALRYHKVNLNKLQRSLLKDSDENPENSADNGVKYARNEDLLEYNRQATEIIGNEAARTVGDRVGQIAEDYSRVYILRRAKMANMGEPLSPKDEAELTTRTKRIAELENKLADREDEMRKLIDKNTVSKVNRAATIEERTAKREVTKATLRKEREGILTELHLIAKKSLGAVGANKIPVDMIVPLTKLARNYVLDGAITIAQVVDKIYNDLKEHLPGVEKDDIAEVIKDGFDRYLTEQNQVRLDRSKKIQAKKLEDLKAGIYEKKTYSKIQVDNDYLKIRAEINREQTLINKKIADIENSNKSIGRKAVDFAVKYGRQAKLASVTVLGKLAATGLTTMTAKALTEAAGAIYSKVLPKIAAKSTVEGGINLSALAKSYARAATLGMEDSWKELNIKKGGQSDLSALYGKYLSTKLPAEAADFFGHLHSAIKAPVKRQAWEYSYAKRFAKSAEKGLDPLDPVVDATNRLNAYKDAERAIFMGDNLISKGYEAAMKTLENSNSGSAKNIAALTRILLPFVKVPTNIALSTGRYALGLIPGVHKVLQVGTSAALRMAGAETMAKVIHTGMGELTPEESDTVLRNLKHGSIGGAALLIGFYNPTNVGGFYQPGEHRKSKDANVGAFKLFGHKIPAYLTEHPIFQAMQIGSTYRRVLDAHRHKQDHKAAAALATASGLAEGIPLAKEAKQITDMFGSDTHKINSFISSAIKGEIEPAVVQQVAQALDTKNGSAISFDGDNQVKRAPDKKHGLIKQLKQDLASGIPVLRKTVPRKH